MKIRAHRADLADALTWTAAAISKRPAHPALAGIRLEACDNELTLAAFDYDTSHTARVDVEVQDDGDCLVNGQFLREIVTALKGDYVELILDSARLEIHSGRSTYRVNTLSEDDFPVMPAFPTVRGKVARDDFADLIATVEHAAARDERLAILTTAHLVGEVGTLSATTTDRFRIARREVMWSIDDPTGTPRAFEANVVIGALSSALKGMSGAVVIGHQEGVFGIRDARRQVTSRCLADTFPKVDAFLSADARDEVEVDARDLAEAVKRASMAAAEHQIVHLAIEDGEITVTAGSESSEGAEYVECWATGPRAIDFNGGYLSASLLAAASERVRLGFAGGPTDAKPVTVRPVDGQRIDLVVMPRRAS